MYFDMAVCAISVLRVLIVLGTCRFISANAVRSAMACQTQLSYPAGYQESWIRRSMRCMTSDAALSFDGCMFINKRPLLISVTFYAGRIRSCGESGLLEFKSTVRIVAITATHYPFKDFVVKRQSELVFDLAVASHAKLRLAYFKQFNS
jgi:hypothetical protein